MNAPATTGGGDPAPRHLLGLHTHRHSRRPCPRPCPALPSPPLPCLGRQHRQLVAPPPLPANILPMPHPPPPPTMSTSLSCTMATSSCGRAVSGARATPTRLPAGSAARTWRANADAPARPPATCVRPSRQAASIGQGVPKGWRAWTCGTVHRTQGGQEGDADVLRASAVWLHHKPRRGARSTQQCNNHFAFQSTLCCFTHPNVPGGQARGRAGAQAGRQPGGAHLPMEGYRVGPSPCQLGDVLGGVLRHSKHQARGSVWRGGGG